MTDTARFLGYDSSSLEEAIFSVIPAPFEETATHIREQAKAPQAILDASSQIEDYDEETGVNLIDQGIHCLNPASAPQDATLEGWLKDQVNAALDQTAVPVILGGEGTVTLWGIQAMLPRCDELSILHIDAHADLADAQGGESHHTVMRRVLELKPAPHICQVGIRSLTRNGFDRIVGGEHSLECFFMSDINRISGESWFDDVVQELRSPVYLTLDLTGFDPAVIPHVGNPEPGGLGWWQVLRLLKKITSRRRIAALDITELCPQAGSIRSDYAAARLAYKIMNYIYAGGKMLEKAQPEEAAEAEAETEAEVEA